MCKWHNSKRAVLSRLRSSPSSPAQPEEQPTWRWDSVSDTRSRHCRVRWCANLLRCLGGLPTCPRTLLRSPAFPPVGHCVTCNGLGRTGIRKPTEVCGGFKHIYIYIATCTVYMATYIYTLTMRIYTLEGGSLTLAQLDQHLSRLGSKGHTWGHRG